MQSAKAARKPDPTGYGVTGPGAAGSRRTVLRQPVIELQRATFLITMLTGTHPLSVSYSRSTS